MRGARVIVLLLILISSYFILNIDNETIKDIPKITTKSILEFNARAVSVVASLLINVDADFPKIYIISPLNKTYMGIYLINLNFTIVEDNLDKIFYNIDNGANTTITGNITFAAGSADGSYVLNLYANDTFGRLNKSSVVFGVNWSKGWNIDWEKFKQGETTNFTIINNTQMQNMSNVTIHYVNRGKIKFISTINISREINISKNVNISFNRIELNSSALPEFDKSAILEIYNLTFSNPRLLKDGSTCSSAICAKNSYSNGTLSFNVTGFSIYSSEETPTETPSPSGSPGGGGGGGSSSIITEKGSIKHIRNVINLKLKAGESTSTLFRIDNNGSIDLKLNFMIEPALEFLFIENNIDRYSLELNKGERKSIEIKVDGSEVEEGIYISKLVITGDNVIKEVIPVVIEVESRGVKLFDVNINIPDEYKVVKPGKNLIFNIELFNLGESDKIDAEIYYSVLDLDGNTVVSYTEDESVETQLTKVKEIKLPLDVKEGKYILSTKAVYFDNKKQKTATSTNIFEVSSKEMEIKISIKSTSTLIIIALLFVLILMTAYVFRSLHIIHKMKFRIGKNILRKKRR